MENKGIIPGANLLKLSFSPVALAIKISIPSMYFALSLTNLPVYASTYNQSNSEILIDNSIIESGANAGVEIMGDKNSVTIAENVTAQGTSGVRLNNDNELNNNGIIIGTGTDLSGRNAGVYINTGTINNNSGATIQSNSDGIFARDWAIVNNAGSVLGDKTRSSSTAIYFEKGGAYIGLEGSTVGGTVNGVTMNSGTDNLIQNAGTINGSNIAFLAQKTSTGSLMNEATGQLVSSDAAAIQVTNDASYNFTNSGYISGGKGTAINFSGSGVNSLTLDTGSTINGSVISSTSDTNTLILKGSGYEDDDFIGSSADNGFKSLTMNGAEWTLAGDINLTGSDTTTLAIDSGSLTLSGTVNSVGDTNVSSNSTLNLANTGVLTTPNLRINDGALFFNAGTLNSNIQNVGHYYGFDVNSPDTLSNSHINGNFTNSGVLQLAGNKSGNNLTIDGNYQGDNGLVILNSALAGDDSVTDKLFITGDSLGKSSLQINNVGGMGAQTLQGLEVIDVNGNSEGEFKLSNRVVAGAYEYNLFKNSSDGDWYLSSSAVPIPTPDPTPDPTPTPTPDPTPTPTPTPTPAPTLYRPETGAYLGNQLAAQSMFITRLHERNAPSNTDQFGGWVHISSDETKTDAAQENLSLKTNTTRLMLGSTLLTADTATGGQYQFGVMAGIGDSKTKSNAENNRNTATGSVTGYDIGMYATWFEDDQRQQGLYVDSWLQYGWYSNNIQSNQLDEEDYRSHGVQASLETGYQFALGNFGLREWVVEPQAQVIYNRYDSENHTETNGSRISGGSDDSVLSRIGVRLSSRDRHDIGALTPYVEVNGENGQYADSLEFNKTRVSNDMPENRYGFRTGLNGVLSKNITMSGEIGANLGENNYSSYQAELGMKVRF